MEFLKYLIYFATQSKTTIDMNNLKIKFRWFSMMMMIALLSLITVACSSIDEASTPISDGQNDSAISTRSAGTAQSLPMSEAMGIAYDVLDIENSESATIQYVTTQRPELLEALGSDIIAYVFNFPISNRSIVIANVACSIPVIATGTQITNVTNGKIHNPWFDSIEDFISDLIDKEGSSTDKEYKYKCLDHHHHIIRNRIKTKVHTGEPFNSYVLKEHPGCHAGSVPTACAAAVEYTEKSFIYRSASYNLPQIRYCLEQGPGFFPLPDPPYVINTLNGIETDKPIAFLYSYDGAVSATSSLISSFGKDMYTSYAKDNSTTYLSDAYRLLEKLGFELSSYKSQFDGQHIWELLDQDYLVIQEAFEKSTNKKTCFIITGGENLNCDKMDASGVLFDVYSVDDPDGYYSFTLNYLADGYAYVNKQYFGIKIEK